MGPKKGLESRKITWTGRSDFLTVSRWDGCIPGFKEPSPSSLPWVQGFHFSSLQRAAGFRVAQLLGASRAATHSPSPSQSPFHRPPPGFCPGRSSHTHAWLVPSILAEGPDLDHCTVSLSSAFQIYSSLCCPVLGGITPSPLPSSSP